MSTDTFPGMDTFHGEMLIGNTLISHRIVAWRRTINRLPVLWRFMQDRCVCGYGPNRQEVIEYHLAREVIDALKHPYRVS